MALYFVVEHDCWWNPKFGHCVKGACTYLVKATNPNPFWTHIVFRFMESGNRNGLIGDISFARAAGRDVWIENRPNWRNSDSYRVVNDNGELLTKVTV